MRSKPRASVRWARSCGNAGRRTLACAAAAWLSTANAATTPEIQNIAQIPMAALGAIEIIPDASLAQDSPCRAPGALAQAANAAADRAARPDSHKPPFDVAAITAKALAGDIAAMKAMGRYSTGEGERIGNYQVGRDWAVAARWYGMAAAKGDAGAMVALSHLFRQGEETQLPRSRRLADLWYDRALADARRRVASGDPQSMVWLGDLLEESSDKGAGFHSKAGMEKAMPWYRRAAAAGNAAGLERLASAYSRGEVVRKDPAHGRLLLRQAAAKGDRTAMSELGQDYASDKDFPNAVAYWMKAAQLGDDWARQELSRRYAAGDGVERDDEEALKWAMMDGEDRADAAFDISFLGEPIPSSDSDLHWTCMAAMAGHPSAMNNVGTSLSGPDRLAWLRAAAEAGDRAGRQNYAKFSTDPVLVARWNAENDAEDREALLGEAARLQSRVEGGDIGAAVQLARLYLDDRRLVDPDNSKSIGLFRQAAESGDPEGMVMYGLMLQQTDRDAGNTWILRAARLGYPRAMWMIGQNLVDGRNIVQDKAAGIAWLRKAVAADNEFAYDDLSRRYAAGDGVPKDLVMAGQLEKQAR